MDRGFGPVSVGVLLCLCGLRAHIICVDGNARSLCIVLGGYLRILCTPTVQVCFTLSISASYRLLVCDRYRKSRLVCVLLSDLDLSRHHPLL